jgi:hypothetical protein
MCVLIFSSMFVWSISHSKTLLDTKCVFWFSLQCLSEAFPILKRSQRDIIINVHRSSRKALIVLVSFYLHLYFLDKLSKNTQMSNSIKIHRVEAESFHADSHTNMTKLTVAFRNVEYAPKNEPSSIGMRMCDSIYLAVDMDRWRELVNMVMNLRILENAGNFLSTWGPLSFAGRTLLYVVRSSHCTGGWVTPQPLWTLLRQNLCFCQDYNFWVSARPAGSPVTVLKYRGFH